VGCHCPITKVTRKASLHLSYVLLDPCSISSVFCSGEPEKEHKIVKGECEGLALAGSNSLQQTTLLRCAIAFNGGVDVG
jgi:hypothetical protein